MPRRVAIYGTVVVLITLGAISHPRPVARRDRASIRLPPPVSYDDSIDVSDGGTNLHAQWLPTMVRN